MVDQASEPGRVEFTVPLQPEQYESLVRLQEITDSNTLEETLKTVLKLHLVLQQGEKQN